MSTQYDAFEQWAWAAGHREHLRPEIREEGPKWAEMTSRHAAAGHTTKPRFTAAVLAADFAIVTGSRESTRTVQTGTSTFEDEVTAARIPARTPEYLGTCAFRVRLTDRDTEVVLVRPPVQVTRHDGTSRIEMSHEFAALAEEMAV